MKRPRKKKPHYSAKPGQSETTQAKEYNPNVSFDLSSVPPWTATTIVEKEGDVLHIRHEFAGGLYLPPIKKRK